MVNVICMGGKAHLQKFQQWKARAANNFF